jgi:hypothetical protein
VKKKNTIAKLLKDVHRSGEGAKGARKSARNRQFRPLSNANGDRPHELWKRDGRLAEYFGSAWTVLTTLMGVAAWAPHASGQSLRRSSAPYEMAAARSEVHGGDQRLGCDLPMDRENRSGKVAVGDRCGRSKVHDLVASRRTLCLRGPLLFHEFYTGEFCHTHCPRNIDAESATSTRD